MATCGIYKITSPIGKSYIGQSRNVERRFDNYKKSSCRKQPKLNDSLRKYGWQTHKFEVIKKCLPEKLNRWEKYYILLYKSISKGSNSNKGGYKDKRYLKRDVKKSTSISLSGETINIINKLCEKQEINPSFSEMVEYLIKSNPMYEKEKENG